MRTSLSSRLVPWGFLLMAGQICVAEDWRLVIAASGEARLTRRDAVVATVQPGLFEVPWKQGAFQSGDAATGSPEGHRGKILCPGGAVVDTQLRPREVQRGVLLDYELVARQDVQANRLYIGLDFPIHLVAKCAYSVDGKNYTVPPEFGNVALYAGNARTLALAAKDCPPIRIEMDTPTPLLVQDNRQWGPSISVRIGSLAETRWAAGQNLRVAFRLTSTEGIPMEYDNPVTITAGEEWIPLDVELDIEPGSALDFSSMGFHDAPAGKRGRVIAGPDGTWAFEDSPGQPVRFYGVNLCFGAHYIAHEQADRLAVRLKRLGYNAVRVHHHEGEMVNPGRDMGSIPVTTPPTRTEVLTSFEAPSQQADLYGARIRGYLHPPASGAYTFWISADDGGELWLSRDEDPSNRKRIASVPGWTGQRQWDKYKEQKSEPIRLEAGRKYYVEALHREGELGDHLAVAWQPPGGETEVIPGASLSRFQDAPGAGKPGTILWEFWPDAKPTSSTRPRPDKLDQIHYLFAALKKQGIYLTTDIYVSRPVLASEIWDGVEGQVPMDDFKMLVPVNDRAFENWKEFATRFLGVTNPCTGMPLAQDPALAWLCMINEGNPGNFIGRIDGRVKAEWQKAWNAFLARRHGSRTDLDAAWKTASGGDPVAGTVPLFTSIYEDSPQARDLGAFLAETEARLFSRMRDFLRKELKCQALLTNMNGWTNRVSTQAARAEYDYVDDHFYVDHPQFLETPWRLPSRCPNTSPIAAGAPGGRHCAFVRLIDKPFTITEYNYSGPGRFRGVGGILTGCLGALQGWSAVWRFTYSHSRDNLFTPSPTGYFDIATDPLNQAAERAAICLYLRGDAKANTHTIGIALAPADLLAPGMPNRPLAPDWHALAWVARVGTFLSDPSRPCPADIVLPLNPGAKTSQGDALPAIDPYAADAGGQVLTLLRTKGWLADNTTDIERQRLQSETREILIDAPRNALVLNTPRTAGGYAPEGETIQTDSVTVRMDKTDATVWVSSVDGQPIRQSRRLIVTHLTDLQNSGIRFGEKARQTLLAWGGLPHLVRTGMATLHIRMAEASQARVWELATSGRRIAPLPARSENGELVITVSVRNTDGRARMTYEIAVE